jgi:hypothetical protein
MWVLARAAFRFCQSERRGNGYDTGWKKVMFFLFLQTEGSPSGEYNVEDVECVSGKGAASTIVAGGII